MSKGPSPGMLLSVAVAVAIAFWAGRTTSPHSSLPPQNTRFGPGSSATVQTVRPKSTGRERSGSAAGGHPLTNALQLRDIFKQHGENLPLGEALAEATLAKMNADELSTIVRDLARAQASTPGYNYMLEIQTACTRWAEIDPAGALEFALAAKQKSFRSTAIVSIIAGIAKNDPALAMEKLAAIDDAAIRQTAQYRLLSAIAVTRPDDWLSMVQSSRLEGYGTDAIVSEWAIDDPAAAANRVQYLSAGSRSSSIGTVARIWASKDPQAAMAWAQSLDDPAQRNLALGRAAGGMAASDPDAALAALVTMDPEARKIGLGSVFETLSDLDFMVALAKAKGLAVPEDRNLALAQLAGFGPVGTSDPFQSGSTSATCEELVAVIPELPDEEVRNNALGHLANQLSNASNEEATRMLERFPPADRQNLWRSMIQLLAGNNPAKASDWISNVSDPQIRTELLDLIDNVRGTR